MALGSDRRVGNVYRCGQSRIRPVPQHRPRNAGLDPRLRARPSLGFADVGETPDIRFKLELTRVADQASLVAEPDPWQGSAAP
jgi:hypothetical protein